MQQAEKYSDPELIFPTESASCNLYRAITGHQVGERNEDHDIRIYTTGTRIGKSPGMLLICMAWIDKGAVVQRTWPFQYSIGFLIAVHIFHCHTMTHYDTLLNYTTNSVDSMRESCLWVQQETRASGFPYKPLQLGHTWVGLGSFNEKSRVFIRLHFLKIRIECSTLPGASENAAQRSPAA